MDKFKLIRARLVLCQRLLEDSDTLPGSEGYTVDEANNTVHHPRHEREALVVYLLLTCFDLLGQSRPYMTFYEWLSSKKNEILEEKKDALDKLNVEVGEIVMNAKLLHDYYNLLYGATKAFYAGVDGLSLKARDHLLSSICVTRRNPESLKPENKNMSYPSLPIEDENKKTKLKLAFLYSLRNSFTHQLSQIHFSSTPSMSQFANNNKSQTAEPVKGASWGVFVLDGVAFYGQHQEQDSKYVYCLKDWPFVLFEVLYSAMGEIFDRTQIKLNMYVFDTGKGFIPSVAHSDLPDILEKYNNVTMPRWRS